MGSNAIPSSVLARVIAEVDHEIDRRSTEPLVLIAEPDARLRLRAMEAVRRAAPQAEVVAASTEPEALALSVRGPELVWLADDERMDAALVVEAIRRRGAFCAFWLQRPPWSTHPERIEQLGVGMAHGGEELLLLFADEVRAALTVLPAHREGRRRAEIAARLAQQYPAAMIRASGFVPPPHARQLPMRAVIAQALENALHEAGGNVASAARILEISRRRVYQEAGRCGLDIGRLRRAYRECADPLQKRA